MADIHTALQSLFTQHGVEVIPIETKALLRTQRLALLDSRIQEQHYPNGVSSQLDVRVIVGNQSIIECFGDIGTTAEEAANNNLRNFAQSSFHVLLAALQNYEDDEYIDIEQWQIGQQQWKVYSGNYTIKATRGLSVSIPDSLFTSIEDIIRQIPLTGELHWFRFFVSCTESQISQLEFCVNNELNAAAEQRLRTLDWELTDDFYSIRLFLLLHKQP